MNLATICCILFSLVSPVWMQYCNGKKCAIVPDEATVGLAGHWGGTKPVHYSINIRVINEIDYSASVRITLQAVQNTNVIYLNAANLNKFMKDMEKPTLMPLNKRHKPIEISSIDEDEEVLTIQIKGNLKKNETYLLEFPYFSGVSNHPLDEAAGIALSHPQTESDRDRQDYWIWTTLFQLRAARKVFPCYDHPALKATYSLCIQHESDVLTFSNTKKINTNEGDHAVTRTCFAKTPPMSTYLFSFVVGKNIPYEKRMLKKSQVEFELLCVPYPSMNCSQLMDNMAPKADKFISTMEMYTGRKYPMTKLGYVFTDVYDIPAMENFGLIVSQSGEASGNDYETMAHEIVHQWIGNMVTIRDWTNLCLQEGLAQYMGKSMANTTPQHFPAESNERPLISPMGRIADMCYSKGAFIWYLLEEYYGSDDYKFIPNFMHHLVDQCEYSNCNIEEWMQAMTKTNAGDDGAARAFEAFYETPGFPVLMAEVIGNNIIINQSITSDVIGQDNHFILPLIYKDSENRSMKIMVDKRTNVIKGMGISFKKPGVWFSITPASHFWGEIIYPVENYISLVKCLKQSQQGQENECRLTPERIYQILRGLLECKVIDGEVFQQDSTDKWERLQKLLRAGEVSEWDEKYQECIGKIILHQFKI